MVEVVNNKAEREVGLKHGGLYRLVIAITELHNHSD